MCLNRMSDVISNFIHVQSTLFFKSFSIVSIYRELFDEYGYDPTTIPFKWMSSWCDPNSTDSSASTIDVFEEDDM